MVDIQWTKMQNWSSIKELIWIPEVNVKTEMQSKACQLDMGKQINNEAGNSDKMLQNNVIIWQNQHGGCIVSTSHFEFSTICLKDALAIALVEYILRS